MTNHKPMCSTNISCAVFHENGVCPNPKPCDCGLIGIKAASKRSESDAISISQIEIEFDRHFDYEPFAGTKNEIKQFYRQKITELLESTKIQLQGCRGCMCDGLDEQTKKIKEASE